MSQAKARYPTPVRVAAPSAAPSASIEVWYSTEHDCWDFQITQDDHGISARAFYILRRHLDAAQRELDLLTREGVES